MVKLSLDNIYKVLNLILSMSIEVVDIFENKGKRTSIEGWRQPVNLWLPSGDVRDLMRIYAQTPHRNVKRDSVQFVSGVDWRIYTEWCMGEGKDKRHGNYSGEGFIDFINQEVHYELERPRSQEDKRSYEGYLRVKERVLRGFVNRSIAIFGDWNGATRPGVTRIDDNLRDELDPYITENFQRAA